MDVVVGFAVQVPKYVADEYLQLLRVFDAAPHNLTRPTNHQWRLPRLLQWRGGFSIVVRLPREKRRNRFPPFCARSNGSLLHGWTGRVSAWVLAWSHSITLRQTSRPCRPTHNWWCVRTERIYSLHASHCCCKSELTGTRPCWRVPSIAAHHFLKQRGHVLGPVCRICHSIELPF